MNKLELKYLAPYLPYRLKWSLQGLKIFVMSGITEETLYTVLNWVKSKDLPQCLFPVFRPLSDLTKEIKVNGEIFIPCELLSEMMDDYNVGYNDYYFDYDNNEWSFPIDHWYTQPYFVVEKLFEWSFDVYGLIEKSLAIDINTLKL